MNLSDDDTSSDESAKPAKRHRVDTFASATSQGSTFQDSEEDNEEHTEPELTNYANTDVQQSTVSGYKEQCSVENVRLSRSSLSENCSSPTEQYDELRPGFSSKDDDNNDDPIRPSFQSNDTFFSKSTDNNDFSEIKVGYSDKSKRMMSNMGYKHGKGLGKFDHGRVEPVEAYNQKGRRGLGLKPSTVGDVPEDFKWSPDDTKPEAKEEVLWMPPAVEPLSGDQLEEWLKKGPKKLTIDDETDFVAPHILKGVLDSKTIFDSLDDEDLRSARFRSNPYETIGSVMFLNRAAVKMANIDAVFGFAFTEPKKPNGEALLDKKDLLYFADVCAGPGGFSEYVLYKKGWRAKGFGFTLKGKCDFKLSNFLAGTPETFNPYYGVKDDGNIFDPANLTSLKDYVLKQTEDRGVHFLMADGGFSVEGQENIQEILSKQLYLCQCLAALMLVRTGGNFVVKLFDVFTLFSVGLIYIMHRCFDKVSLHKPVTSRPANSERYLICLGKKLGAESSEHHLYSVNSILWNGLDRGEDVTELVPLSVIREDAAFFDYIYNSNCILGERQIKNLLKIAAFSKDKNLKENSQQEMKEQCLKLWQIPDEMRKQPERLSSDDNLLKILALMKTPPSDCHSANDFKSNILNKPPKYLSSPTELEMFKNVYDWHIMFLGSGRKSQDLKMFISCGGKQVYQLDGLVWKLVDFRLTMPAKTLIYAEIVKELSGQGNNQMYSKSLHVIDAIMLGGIDISNMTLTERINQCSLFCSSLEKPTDEAVPMRCKRLFNMEHFPTAVHNLEIRATKRLKRAVTIDTPNRNRDGSERFYVVESVLFIKEIKRPWSAAISKKHGCKYYFCPPLGPGKNGRSEFFIPDDAKMDTINAYTGRIMWPWEKQATALLEGLDCDGVTRADLENYIQLNIHR